VIHASLGSGTCLHTYTLFDAAGVLEPGPRRSKQQALRIGSRMISSNDIVFLPGLGGGVAVNSMPADVEFPKSWDIKKSCAVSCIVRLLRGNW